MKVKIHILSEDTDANGTSSTLFGTEAELTKALVDIMQASNPSPKVEKLIKAGEIEEAWNEWEDNERDPLDTYSVDAQEVEVPIP